MSQWTHISGTFRVDGFDFESITRLTEDDKKDVTAPCPMNIGIMTPEYDFDATDNMTPEQKDNYYKLRRDQWEAAEKSGIPMGSEGSLEWSWIGLKDSSSVCRGHYVITGDLRDYDSAEPIFQWVKKIVAELKVKNYWIRQMAIHVDVEGELPIFIGMKDEEVVMYKTAKNSSLIYET